MGSCSAFLYDISLSIRSSKFIQLVSNGGLSFFPMAEYIPLYIYYLVFTYLWISPFFFFFFFLLRTSRFIPFWSKKIFGMILIFLNLLRVGFDQILCSDLNHFSYAHEKNVYYSAGSENFISPLRFIESTVLFRATGSLLIFTLHICSITKVRYWNLLFLHY